MINAIRTPGRQYVNIHDISEELARDGTSTVEMLTMLVQAMWRGEFDGHMRVDGIELDSRDILSAAQNWGLFKGICDDHIDPVERRGELATWTYADYPTGKLKGDPSRTPQAYSFRDTYLDKLEIKWEAAIQWNEAQVRAATRNESSVSPSDRCSTTARLPRVPIQFNRAKEAILAIWPNGEWQTVMHDERLRQIKKWCGKDRTAPSRRTIDRVLAHLRSAK